LRGLGGKKVLAESADDRRIFQRNSASSARNYLSQNPQFRHKRKVCNCRRNGSVLDMDRFNSIIGKFGLEGKYSLFKVRFL
jgi:hypothetical protein